MEKGDWAVDTIYDPALMETDNTSRTVLNSQKHGVDRLAPLPSRLPQGLERFRPRALELEPSSRRLGSSTGWDKLGWFVVQSSARNTFLK